MERYFDRRITELNLARHGSSRLYILKPEYKFLEFDFITFANTPEVKRPKWIPLERGDLKGSNGRIGLTENTTCYRVVAQEEFNYLEEEDWRGSDAGFDRSSVQAGSARDGSDAGFAHSSVTALRRGVDSSRRPSPQ
jgi:hypothetical protein